MDTIGVWAWRVESGGIYVCDMGRGIFVSIFDLRAA